MVISFVMKNKSKKKIFLKGTLEAIGPLTVIYIAYSSC